MAINIANNLELIKDKLLNTNAKLIAVTKTRPIETLMNLYNLDFKRFGENKVQELVDKYEALPKDIEWHLIGHLQTNKVKYIAPFVSLIHSVDSIKLLEEINKQGFKNQRTIPCLLQIYIAKEETKFGLSEMEVTDIFTSEKLKQFENINIIGLMGMASNTDDKEIITAEFKRLKIFFDKLQAQFKAPNINLTELSMGMSGDFEIAASQGSTMVRVGSAIFGERDYLK
jgi:PLP dependent protein